MDHKIKDILQFRSRSVQDSFRENKRPCYRWENEIPIRCTYWTQENAQTEPVKGFVEDLRSVVLEISTKEKIEHYIEEDITFSGSEYFEKVKSRGLGGKIEGEAMHAGIGGGLNLGVENRNMGIKEKANQTKRKSYKEISSYVYPMGMCKPKKHMLSLTDASIIKLKEILNALNENQEQHAEGLCKRFFTSYGSHADLSEIHFGGIFVEEKTHLFQEELALEEEQENKNRGVSGGGRVKLVGGNSIGLNAHMDRSKATRDTVDSKEADTGTTVHKWQIGGSKDLELNSWKDALKRNHETWQILISQDTERKGTSYLPIWELVEKSMIYAERLAKFLQAKWSEFTGLGVPERVDQENEDLIYETQHSIDVLNSIIQEDDTISCVQELLYLNCHVHGLENGGKKEIWMNILSKGETIDTLNRLIKLKFTAEQELLVLKSLNGLSELAENPFLGQGYTEINFWLNIRERNRNLEVPCCQEEEHKDIKPRTIHAHDFCVNLKKCIEEKMTNKLLKEIEEIICPVYQYNTKAVVIKEILKDLAHLKDFDSYKHYIANPFQHAFEFFKNKVRNDVYQAKTREDMPSIFWGFLKGTLAYLIYQIFYALQVISDTEKLNSSEWKTQVEYGMGRLGFDLKLEDACEPEALLCIIAHIIDMEKSIPIQVENQLKAKLAPKADDKQFKEIFKEIWGCEASCPWCKEPCEENQHSPPNKINHRASIHRSSGIGGLSKGGKLMKKSCGYNVYSNNKADCGKWCSCDQKHRKKHDCEDYKEVMENWNIPSSKDVSISDYWKWFLVQFRSDLANHYHATEPHIPQEWGDITEEMALKSLQLGQI